ncbi:MAG: hypothetical protein NHB32_18840 [Fischerella sp. CENA71]|nr:hypothetical protein [Fischerella sp. CENA71]
MIRTKPGQKIALEKVEATLAQLEKLEQKAKEDLSLRESIYFLREQLQSALKKGYSYKDLSEILAQQEISISEATLKQYLREIEKEKRLRKQRTKSKQVKSASKVKQTEVKQTDEKNNENLQQNSVTSTESLSTESPQKRDGDSGEDAQQTQDLQSQTPKSESTQPVAESKAVSQTKASKTTKRQTRKTSRSNVN